MSTGSKSKRQNVEKFIISVLFCTIKFCNKNKKKQTFFLSCQFPDCDWRWALWDTPFIVSLLLTVFNCVDWVNLPSLQSTCQLTLYLRQLCILHWISEKLISWKFNLELEWKNKQFWGSFKGCQADGKTDHRRKDEGWKRQRFDLIFIKPRKLGGLTCVVVTLVRNDFLKNGKRGSI